MGLGLGLVELPACQLGNGKWETEKWKLTSTLSQRQLPHGAPSTTSQRTLRARHDTQARAALRFVAFCGTLESSPPGAIRFLLFLSAESEEWDEAGEAPSFEGSGTIVSW